MSFDFWSKYFRFQNCWDVRLKENDTCRWILNTCTSGDITCAMVTLFVLFTTSLSPKYIPLRRICILVRVFTHLTPTLPFGSFKGFSRFCLSALIVRSRSLRSFSLSFSTSFLIFRSMEIYSLGVKLRIPRPRHRG